MLPFGLTVFGGAFLLFLVQLVMARFILPWFGGSPAVWTTCMLFFQVLLLGGYAWAHWIIRQLMPRRQVVAHLALLVVALALLPITPGEHWKPADGTWPATRILLLLTACVGVPYLALAATGPLLQAWFSQTHPGIPPFRLYALSNVGSLLALAAYPVLVEPNMSRRAQAAWWSIGLVVFVGLAGWCGWIVWKRGRKEADAEAQTITAPEAQPKLQAVPATNEVSVSTGNHCWLWFALPACSSMLLLAVTNKISQDIAVVPFLWVLPLGLYLVSFILAFDSPRWYWRPLWLPLFVLALASVLWIMPGVNEHRPTQSWLRWLAWLLQKGATDDKRLEIGVHLAAMLVCCMVCHGEVYRLRPPARRLTGYYLSIAAGGAFGGFLVAIVAPLVFKDYFEMHAAWFAVVLLLAALLFTDARSWIRGGRHAWAWGLILLAVAGTGWGFYRDAHESLENAVEVSRNFHGVLKVLESKSDDPAARTVILRHGSTTHGLQFIAEGKHRVPTSYYTSGSGIGRAMNNFPRHENRRVGVVGLGAGSLTVYGQAGDYFRIYEINDEVQRLARSRFTYLKDCPANVEIVPGDARLSMERESSQQFDILALDAFTGDAIPVHLLTREAFELYLRELKPDGVIVVHISNRYLRLEPVVMLAADHFGLKSAIIYDEGLDRDETEEEADSVYASDWVLLSRNEELLKSNAITDNAQARGKYSPKIHMWTDEESNLFRILTF